MKKLKIITVVGTRPEIIRLSRIIPCLDEYCDHIFVHTGQNYDYELNQIFFDDLEIRQPDYFLNCAKNGDNAATSIGNLIISIDKLLADITPDAMLVLGDTNSCLSVIPAKRRKIPVFHMEAGNRCFDMRVPEEINRRIIDHVADINLTYSSIARDYLIKEGLPPDLVIKTGSPMQEVLSFYGPKIKASSILSQLGITKRKYFLVSVHREENVEPAKSLAGFVDTLNTVADLYGLPVIVSTHPRTKLRIEENQLNFHSGVRLIKPLGFCDYVNLQISARATLSDSGTINEESSILNFPALNLRDAHERPEGMEEAAVMMVGLSPERVIQGLRILENQKRGASRSLRLVNDYNAPNVSEKVLRIIHSYTDYANRVIWKNY